MGPDPIVVRHIRTSRFLVRTLNPDDATERYLRWFEDPAVRRFIRAAREPQSIPKLRAFITEKTQPGICEFCGIFTWPHRLHIGNIKFEPIDRAQGTAIVGVLIGDPAWRGRGVFKEVFAATSVALWEDLRVRRFWLGVDRDNASAISSYENVGFRQADPPASVIGSRDPSSTYLLYEVPHAD